MYVVALHHSSPDVITHNKHPQIWLFTLWVLVITSQEESVKAARVVQNVSCDPPEQDPRSPAVIRLFPLQTPEEKEEHDVHPVRTSSLSCLWTPCLHFLLLPTCSFTHGWTLSCSGLGAAQTVSLCVSIYSYQLTDWASCVCDSVTWSHSSTRLSHDSTRKRLTSPLHFVTFDSGVQPTFVLHCYYRMYPLCCSFFVVCCTLCCCAAAVALWPMGTIQVYLMWYCNRGGLGFW